MPLLVRKIERSKWNIGQFTDIKDVNSDAITLCCRTSRNTLSVWAIDKQEDIDEAVLALGSGFDHIDSFDLVVFDEDDLKNAGLTIEATKGKCPVSRLDNTHRDIMNLTYGTLGIVAKLIAQKLIANEFKRITVSKLRTILQDAVDDGSLDTKDIRPDVRNKLHT